MDTNSVMIDKWIKTTMKNSGLFTGIQIHPIVMPQGFNYPAIVYSRIDSTDQGSKDFKTGHISPERWSFGCYAKTLSQIRVMEENLKSTFDAEVSPVEKIQFMYLADVSSDFYDEEFGLFSVNVDFYIRRINGVSSSHGSFRPSTSNYVGSYIANFQRTGATPTVRSLQTVIENTTGQTVTVSLETQYGADYLIIDGIELTPNLKYAIADKINELTVSNMEANTEYRVVFGLTPQGDKYGINLQKKAYTSQQWINADTTNPFEVIFDITIYK